MPPAAPPPRDTPSSRSSGPATASPGLAAGATSIGLSRRGASLLAYSAGWISGLLVLRFEGRDHEVRFHAAQSLLAFGALTLIGLLLMVLALVGLVSSLTLFRVSLWAAQGLIVVGLGLWLYALVRVALGGEPRWAGIAGRAERLAALAATNPRR